MLLFSSPRAEEWPERDRDGTCERIIGGFELVMTLSIAEAFSTPVDLTLYPSYAMSVEYPIDLSTIKVSHILSYHFHAETTENIFLLAHSN